ncbi:MAG: non-canonical purine NTP pyrophosphatase, RdgB/HAM1 family [Euryarchaeota archaeon]|nr:non-canonical purine NTP pyrophosphatase, RdgB/HAM1 family [Euryarchaeota archaeon]|tara:strand:- start:3052 stop:3645 length:594 start_codon:yes stop_codon:yes gene_type:complete
MRIIFVTSNNGKVSEASKIFAPLGHAVEQFLNDGITPQFSEPQSEGIEEVTISKMEQALVMTGGPADDDTALMVEDAGLFIESLGGFPGPYSSYVEEKIGLDGILRIMNGEENRNAEFRAVIAFHYLGQTHIFRGKCEGSIDLEKRGKGGFGYDPIFVPFDSDGRTCAEMSAVEKSSISHRGKALNKLLEFLAPPSM